MTRIITTLVLGLSVLLMSTGCYAPKLKSCLASCDSDDDCAPGHSCLTAEGLCIDSNAPAQECRGAQENAPPILDFWFGDQGADRSLVDRSGYLITTLVQTRAPDPKGDVEILANNQRNEFFAPTHLQLQSPYSVAAWIFIEDQVGQVPIFTEEFSDRSYRTLVGLDASGRLEVRLSCSGSEDNTAHSDVKVPRNAWTHIAAVVTGEWVFFYHNGIVVDVVALTLPTQACDPADHYNFLYTELGTVLLYALRFYDVRLSEEEIVRLASAGRLESPARCGDGVIDPDEACDGHSACCADDCRFVSDGSSCGGIATCLSGICIDSATRTDAPTLLYTFDTAGSSILADEGSLDLPLSTPGDTGSYRFADGALTVEGRVVASAEVGQTLDTCQTAGMTVEVTMVDGSPLDDNETRIVSLNADPNGGDTVFDLGPKRGQYLLRFVDRSNDRFGRPTLYSPPGDAKGGNKTHLVVTVSPDGERTMYIDGSRRASFRAAPILGEWPQTIPFAIANVATCDGTDGQCRDWEGTLYTVAVYCRPLSEIEVGNNAAAELELLLTPALL